MTLISLPRLDACCCTLYLQEMKAQADLEPLSNTIALVRCDGHANVELEPHDGVSVHETDTSGYGRLCKQLCK